MWVCYNIQISQIQMSCIAEREFQGLPIYPPRRPAFALFNWCPNSDHKVHSPVHSLLIWLILNSWRVPSKCKNEDTKHPSTKQASKQRVQGRPVVDSEVVFDITVQCAAPSHLSLGAAVGFIAFNDRANVDFTVSDRDRAKSTSVQIIISLPWPRFLYSPPKRSKKMPLPSRHHPNTTEASSLEAKVLNNEITSTSEHRTQLIKSLCICRVD